MPSYMMSYKDFSGIEGVHVEKSFVPGQALSVRVGDVPQGHFVTKNDPKLGTICDISLRTPIKVGGESTSNLRITNIS